MARYRNYSDEDKAAVIAFYDACQNYAMAARECRVPAATIQDWVKQRDNPSSPPTEFVEEKREAIADRLEHIVHLLIDSVPGKIEDAPLSATMVGIGIGIDKKRLEREQATSITDDLSNTKDELDAIAERVKLRMVSGGS